MRKDWRLLGAVVFLILAAPLPFGSVETGPSALLTTACLALGAVHVLSSREPSRAGWRRPVLFWGGAFALLGLMQSVPLPPAALRLVSPEASELRDRYEPRALPAGVESPPEPPPPGWRPISLNPWASRQAALRFMGCLSVALVVAYLAARSSNAKAIASAIVASGSLQALYGLIEYFTGRQRILGYAKEYYADVATGTFINRNHFAGFMEMAIPFAVALGVMKLVRGAGDRRSGSRDAIAAADGRDMFLASLFMVCALLMTTALACSRSRTGIASATLSFLGAGAVLLWRGRGKAFAVAGVVIAIVTFLLVSQGAGVPIVRRFLETSGDLQSGMGRWSIWTQSASLIEAFPFLGVGLGSFEHVIPLYRTAGMGTGLAHAHNELLELAAETGLAGCLIVLAGSIAIARAVIREGSARGDHGHLGAAAFVGAAALGLHSLADFNLAIPANALLFAILIGILLASRRRSGPVLVGDLPGGAGSAGSGAGRIAVASILAVAAFLAACGGASWWIDGRWAGGSLARLLDGDDASRLLEATMTESAPAFGDLDVLTTSSTGGRASDVSLAYVEKRLRTARGFLEQGLRRTPVSSRGHLVMGRIQGALCVVRNLREDRSDDCVEEAARELRAALTLNPMSAWTLNQIAGFYVSAWPSLPERHREEARSIIVRATSLSPPDQELKARWETLR